jgi:hypothetical protein
MTGAERQRRFKERRRREREEAARKAGKPLDPSPKEEPSEEARLTMQLVPALFCCAWSG